MNHKNLKYKNNSTVENSSILEDLKMNLQQNRITLIFRKIRLNYADSEIFSMFNKRGDNNFNDEIEMAQLIITLKFQKMCNIFQSKREDMTLINKLYV